MNLEGRQECERPHLEHHPFTLSLGRVSQERDGRVPVAIVAETVEAPALGGDPALRDGRLGGRHRQPRQLGEIRRLIA